MSQTSVLIESQSETTSFTTRREKKEYSVPKPAARGPSWGRHNTPGFWTVFSCILIIVACPPLVLYLHTSCELHGCSIISPVLGLFSRAPGESVYSYVSKHIPPITAQGTAIYTLWLLFQFVLERVLPGPTCWGNITPGGNLLKYTCNGLNAWIITHSLMVLCSLVGLVSPSLFVDRRGELFLLATVYGALLALFAFVKAFVKPTHESDRKFSGNWLYDFYMGIEINPRVGSFDFKLFHNGRIGIVAWTLINLSYAAKQYQMHGYVSDSMVLVNVLQAIYVIDFFWYEDWYLRTIDIQHEHFGWYLAWGDAAWLPFIYTLQGLYLVYNPVDLGLVASAALLLMGITGYYIFRTTNNQKDLFRSSKGKCKIWGNPATFVPASYRTEDGKTHQSMLLTSGFWGISRHSNYLGDLMLAYSWCLTCGFSHLLPYTYAIFLTILLLHRVQRDQQRCHGKYGKAYEEYCARVPYKIIPYVY